MTTVIRKGEENRLVLTLKELALESLPENNTLFVFSANNHAETKKVFLDNVSTSEKFDQFDFTEGNEVSFSSSGEYTYRAYQMPDKDDTNESRGHLLEVGMLKVLKASQITRKSRTSDTTRKVYKDE